MTTYDYQRTTEPLTADQVRAVLVAAKAAGAREHALVAMLLYGYTNKIEGVLAADAGSPEPWVPPEARPAVAKLVAEQGPGPLFRNRGGGPLTGRGGRLSRRGAGHVLAAVGRAALIGRPLNARVLRATAAHLRDRKD